MPIDSGHRDYNKRLPDVKKVRDFVDEDVTKYVRKLRGHDDEDYTLYSNSAYYLPALGRTIDAFVGMVMEPEPVVTGAPKAFDTFLDDLSNDGEPFTRVTARVVREVVSAARGCVLVDYPDRQDAANVTRLQAENMGLRPYARFYPFEDVLNWRVDVVDGRRVLSHLRLIEKYEALSEDGWDVEEDNQIRVLDLIDGKYRVQIWRETKVERDGPRGSKITGLEWCQHGPDRYPTANSANLESIPAVIFGPDSLDPSIVDRPPLIEVVGISESHLNNSAGREWSLMWCGSPTLVIAGNVPLDNNGNPEPIYIGSSSAIVLGEGSTADLLEAGSEAVGALQKAMEDKRRDMASVGARVLTDGGSSQISTETARLERAGEHSVLAGVANTVADGMTQVLRLLATWAGISGADKIAVSLNTNFVPVGLQPGELAEWLGEVQKGNMPLSVALERLKSRGVVDAEMTEQDWRDETEAAALDMPEDDFEDEQPDDPVDQDEEEEAA